MTILCYKTIYPLNIGFTPDFLQVNLKTLDYNICEVDS